MVRIRPALQRRTHRRCAFRATCCPPSSELELDRVDWVKIDSQGTDLRLFRSLGEEFASRRSGRGVRARDHRRLRGRRQARRRPPRDARARLLGVRSDGPRLDASRRGRCQRALGARASRYLDARHRPAPGWVEIEYFNGFDDERLGKRELLLGFVFAFMRRHYAFALELAVRGRERLRPPFDELGPRLSAA